MEISSTCLNIVHFRCWRREENALASRNSPQIPATSEFGLKRHKLKSRKSCAFGLAFMNVLAEVIQLTCVIMPAPRGHAVFLLLLLHYCLAAVFTCISVLCLKVVGCKTDTRHIETEKRKCLCLYNTYSKQVVGLNIFYSEEKDWAWHTTRQCPLQVVATKAVWEHLPTTFFVKTKFVGNCETKNGPHFVQTMQIFVKKCKIWEHLNLQANFVKNMLSSFWVPTVTRPVKWPGSHCFDHVLIIVSIDWI